MFDLMKPGHILRFGTCPSTIISPPALASENRDNTLETAWPTTSNLGLVQCFSHPSGNIGNIAADVAKRLRTTMSIQRSLSYSALGRAASTTSNRVVGSLQCDFVGYVDGQSNYIRSDRTVFSKDFSGCLMVVYTFAGQRRVAHAASSGVATMDCKQAFLNTLQRMGATLNGWFRPYVDARYFGRKSHAFGVFGKYISNDINELTTFGVVTNTNHA